MDASPPAKPARGGRRAQAPAANAPKGPNAFKSFFTNLGAQLDKSNQRVADRFKAVASGLRRGKSVGSENEATAPVRGKKKRG